MGVVQCTAARAGSEAAAIAWSCLQGCAFELDGDQARIEQIHRCRAGMGGDVVVIRFEMTHSYLRSLRQAMQARTFIQMVRRGRVSLLPGGTASPRTMRDIPDDRVGVGELARPGAPVGIEIDAVRSAHGHGRRRHRRRAHEDRVRYVPDNGGASTRVQTVAVPARRGRAAGK
ncbi:hypothetical protein [Sphingomonas sp. Ant20]|jgi:hypothetical protein|uniref:hypothetical protein n=1 Tax=Sphingomonas sp. Ant20 TaxID=104605 RepID=UPI00053649EA|nr:hypothetical protein [Sphingomonas sp. Ant20]KHA65169.1 hypothetical protein NI18_03570 [Sphingomonas sp. Ant20]